MSPYLKDWRYAILLSVTVSVVGNGIGDSSSNLERGFLRQTLR